MANERKFNNPVRIHPQIEKEDKDWIKENTDNMTEFINEAIREKIEREERCI